MGVEAVPVVGAGLMVPGPVRSLEVLEDDARITVALLSVAPDVEVAGAAARSRRAGTLKPGVLIGRVIEHQLRDHAQTSVVRLPEECMEVAHRPVGGMDAGVVRNLVCRLLLEKK